MSKKATLPQKRTELKEQLTRFRALPEYMLDGIGALLQYLISPKTARSRKSFLPENVSEQYQDSFPSFWLSGALIAAFTFLIGWLVSYASAYRPTTEELRLMIWSSFAGALALIVNKVNIRTFLDTFRKSCVDRMLRVSDIDELSGWLQRNFGLWLPLLSGLAVGPLLGRILYASWLKVPETQAVFQLGPFVTIVLSCIQAVWVAFYLYPFYVAFPSRLNRYRFDLYTSNPSSSEVIEQLSRLLTFILYATMGYIVQLTIGLTYIGVLNTANPLPIVIFSVFVWAPTVVLYATGQFHLSNVITYAKWKTLNEVQSKIESLYNSTSIPDKDLLDHIDKLMDYHDRIKSTPNSALDFRTGLNFLNSLLFPILAFFLKDVPTYINTLIPRN
ncbi:MAG: hypothetical protein H6634_18750 [Anaerolineales bacterium]|nr:hypothetical protein [Anaerolineales bacterium]